MKKNIINNDFLTTGVMENWPDNSYIGFMRVSRAGFFKTAVTLMGNT